MGLEFDQHGVSATHKQNQERKFQFGFFYEGCIEMRFVVVDSDEGDVPSQ